MRKAAALLILAMLLMTIIPSHALAQEDECTEDDCEECTDCKTNNFYYILVAAICVFLVFFYLRNRAGPTVMRKKDGKGEPPKDG